VAPAFGSELPVRAALPALGAALRRSRRVVLVAPPGSGKTTLVAPWLLDSGLVPKGEIVVLQPRRVAARSVARFMADMRGERVGETVGFQVRFEQEVSARTRIRVVTEGILTARLQASPDLQGVAAVVLDEFHERSIHADLALALLKEVQDVLRDDLLVIVMSATLDAAPIAAFLGDCEIVRAEGRSFEVTTAFADDGLSIGPGTHPRDVEARMARGVLDVIARGVDGDVLGFLPGVRLIEGTRQRLAGPLAQRGFDVEVLHGSLGPREQDQVLRSGERPRVVLATNIAETSLTIPGVRAVVDSGLAKVMRHDLAVGSGRLETGRISKASADQRRGRAGRLGPGHCLRLWTRFEDERLVPFEAPEIRRVDLARMVLELASWGADPMDFGYFEAPDERALADARRRLVLMGALDARMKLTALGKALAELPCDPRVAAFLVAVAGRAPRALDEASSWAAVLDGGEATGDLSEDVKRAGLLPHIERAARQLGARAKSVRVGAGAGVGVGAGVGLRQLLLAGYADRVGARREGTKYALVGGRLGELDTPIAGDFIVALELEAGRRGEGATSRILSYAAVERAWLEAHPLYRVADELVWDAGERRVVAFRTSFFVDLALERKSVPNRDRERSGTILAERAAAALGEVFGGLAEEEDNLLARLATLARLHPQLGLPSTREGWLAAAVPAMAAGLSSFGELIKKPAVSLSQALVTTLGWELERRLREELPERLEVPSGSHLKLAYSADGLPALAVKIQEVFGLQATPTVARGRLPVVMHLLSPGGRPLQVTSDLASFWTRTWPEVRSEMRSRYPKHHWPEDPAKALPSARTRDRKLKPDGGSK